jgi:hypothetical protein
MKISLTVRSGGETSMPDPPEVVSGACVGESRGVSSVGGIPPVAAIAGLDSVEGENRLQAFNPI